MIDHSFSVSLVLLEDEYFGSQIMGGNGCNRARAPVTDDYDVSLMVPQRQLPHFRFLLLTNRSASSPAAFPCFDPCIPLFPAAIASDDLRQLKKHCLVACGKA
jgi:hypothetical protein